MYKKFIISILIILLLSGCWEIKKGEKTGYIVKLAQEGAFIKTYEAELIRGGFNNGSGSNGASFDFTIENLSLLPIIQESIDNHKIVKIKYHQEFATIGRCESNDYFLDDIEIVK